MTKKNLKVDTKNEKIMEIILYLIKLFMYLKERTLLLIFVYRLKLQKASTRRTFS